MRNLNNKTAIVTGAGSGIGRAIAIRLATEGAKVIANDLNPDAVEQTIAQIKKMGLVAMPSIGDVTIPEDVEATFSLCEKNWGSCDILVNNAGIVQQKAFVELSVDDWDRMISVHLRGCFLGCQRAIKSMLVKKSGVIVNMASQLGQIGAAELVHYSAAKAGIIGLTKALAREVSQHGIRVNTVAPGPIDTELTMKLSETWRKMKTAQLPLGQFGTAEDVAATVSFLVSDDAKIYVGQTLGPNSGDVML
ncbi:MAG: 3-oxoacyl-ACP reductase FabG [Rhizobiales bacterium]|nr:3-oxoacyl-ACP reductase FabG [Hyphomicrobiales bacterium]